MRLAKGLSILFIFSKNQVFISLIISIVFLVSMSFKKNNIFIYLFLAVLGLRCCARAFCSCGERGYSSSLRCAGFSLQWLLLLQSTGPGHAGSVVVVSGLSSCGSRALGYRLSSCGAWAYLLHEVWDPLGPGIKLVSPALAGRFLTTAPPGKSPLAIF